MANKVKEHWYVIVMTKNGAVFVTGTRGYNTAKQDKDKPPMEYSKGYAKDMAFGLTVNGYLAFAVSTNYELKTQPYNYANGNFYWRKKKEKKNEN